MAREERMILGFTGVDRENAGTIYESIANSFEPFPLAERFRGLPDRGFSEASGCLPNTYLEGVEKAVPDTFISLAYNRGTLRLELRGHDVTEKDLDALYALRFKGLLEPKLGRPVRIEAERPPREYHSLFALSASAP